MAVFSSDARSAGCWHSRLPLCRALRRRTHFFRRRSSNDKSIGVRSVYPNPLASVACVFGDGVVVKVTLAVVRGRMGRSNIAIAGRMHGGMSGQ